MRVISGVWSHAIQTLLDIAASLSLLARAVQDHSLAGFDAAEHFLSTGHSQLSDCD